MTTLQKRMSGMFMTCYLHFLSNKAMPPCLLYPSLLHLCSQVQQNARARSDLTHLMPFSSEVGVFPRAGTFMLGIMFTAGTRLLNRTSRTTPVAANSVSIMLWYLSPFQVVRTTNPRLLMLSPPADPGARASGSIRSEYVTPVITHCRCRLM
jgi:hypothetical protein